MMMQERLMEVDDKEVGERWRRPKQAETTKVGEGNQSRQNRRIDKFVEGRERGDNQNQRKEIKLPHNKVEITEQNKMDSEGLRFVYIIND